MKSIVTLLILLTTLQAAALEGHDRGGGGDPRAVKFLNFGTAAAESLKEGPLPSVEDVDAKLLRDEVQRLYASLDEKQPQLRFRQTEYINCFGVEKKGCRNSDGTIDVAGKYWEDSKTSEEDRCVLALTELIRAQSRNNVYKKADVICRSVKSDLSKHSSPSFASLQMIAAEAIAIPAGQSSVPVTSPKQIIIQGYDMWFACELSVETQAFERTISKNAIFYITTITTHPKVKMTANDLRAQFKAFSAIDLSKELTAEEVVALVRNRYGLILPTESYTSNISITSKTSGAKAAINCVSFDEQSSKSVLGSLLKFGKIVPVSEF